MPVTRRRWSRWLGNISIILISTLIAVLLCEWGLRFIIDPVDYLSAHLVRDDILGIHLPPGSGGHDRWGFRNSKVPDSAEIVTIGDSHTYGNCAKMNEAWPQVLAKLSGKKVYNLGMGGYGPNQYYQLFQTKALSLKPRIVICGLYMGDDFDNAFRITYGLSHWASLREGGLPNVDPDIWEKNFSERPGLQKRVREWLSENSLIYRLVVHGVLQRFKARYQFRNVSRSYENIATLDLPDKNLQEAFSPKWLLRGLDQQEESVREGMRITFKLLREMNAACSSRGIKFVVAVIPTKESVFSRYLERNTTIDMSESIHKVIVNERAAREKLFQMLSSEEIKFVDLLPALEAASEKEKLYTYHVADMHPGKQGYRVIAEAILKSPDALTK